MSVAPLAGAWIETRPLGRRGDVEPVAPLAGAWIETLTIAIEPLHWKRRAPRGRVD